MAALLRVYLGDDDVLRSLGLHNTFKTIPVTEDTIILNLQTMLMQRLVKGMTPQQKEILESACQNYVITEIVAEQPVGVSLFCFVLLVLIGSVWFFGCFIFFSFFFFDIS